MTRSINVLFLAAEAEPFVKIGGLADVAGTLPRVLRNLKEKSSRDINLDVRLALPFHQASKTESATMLPVTDVAVYRQGGNVRGQVYKTVQTEMPVYFINSEILTSSPSVYSADAAADRDKYTFFSLAVLDMLRNLDWYPDIIHANDWHTALSLYALRSRRLDPLMGQVRTVFTIHNLPFMGGDGTDVLKAYGLMPPTDESLPIWARSQPLPLGLWSADAIIPVSPTYAREIRTPEFGCGLDQYLQTRSNDIIGILNGLDLLSFNPETDTCLAENFNTGTIEKRVLNKRALQSAVGLVPDSTVPLLAMIGRIDRQKGVDITIDALRQLVNQNWQFVLLGSGDQELEARLVQLQDAFPEKIRVVLRYDAALGRKIYGGADIFLMPSRYEPCGLAQMIAMHYGCVPVVRATGGLLDTVVEGKTGFLFQEPSAAALCEAISRALTVFVDRAKWHWYQQNAMQEDFSWARSARQYADVYYSLIPTL